MARGTVQIDSQRCKGCGLCIAVCPQHVLAFSPQLNAQGYRPVTLIDTVELLAATPAARAPACTGCALCALVCPDTVFQVYREVVRRGVQETRGIHGARAAHNAGAAVADEREVLHERIVEG